jgi:Sulfotransferase domain
MFGFGKSRVEKLEFIVAGAQKSGTTALNYYLKRHPRIALPVKKELHFFDKDELFTSGNVSYEPLHEMFRPARAGSIAGENTPIYLYWRPALPRIRDYNPAMKFIVILRNPIERAFSQWNMQRTRGIEPLDFVEAVQAEPGRIAASAPKQLRKFSYVDRGRYGEQLERAFRLFPQEQFLVIKYEDFRARQRQTVETVFRFLNVEPTRFRAVEAHDIPYARKIRDEERAAVRDILQSDIARLEALLRWDCSDWR